MRPRRAAPAIAVAAAMALIPALGGCTMQVADPAAGLWHRGHLAIGTGPTNGTFNQVGAGYADVINRHLTGYEAVAAPTNGAGDNLRRIASGDVDIGFTFADTAADAVNGEGTFSGGKVEVRALARVFNNYAHLVARADLGVRSLADLRGKRVGTGPQGSGTEGLSLRLLASAGLRPDADVRRTAASLSQTVALMRSGDLDAMFYSAGLPVTGVTAVLSQSPGRFVLVPVAGALAQLEQRYPGVYVRATIPKATYATPADVPTLAVPTLIVVSADMPEGLAYELTRLIFDHQAELAAVHPEGANIKRELAPRTAPVLLHPGAARYYGIADQATG